MLRTAATRGLDPRPRVSEQGLLERLLPNRRLRSQPRVVMRKMFNYQLRRPEHQLWPQPTRTGTQAIFITSRQPTDP